jgi:hypothetical protein
MSPKLSDYSCCKRPPRAGGYSLVELLVAATIMLMVLAMVYTAMLQTRKIALRNEIDVEIVQHARIAVDEMARTLRLTGYGIDRPAGQFAVIEAAPFQLLFNADVNADFPALTSTGMVYRYDATAYSPPRTYRTGAETIRWTLDTTDDGVVDQLDTQDDEEEQYSARNPNDMVLIQEVNGGNDRQMALHVLGPYDGQGQPTGRIPLFQYWLTGEDPASHQPTFFLWGDCNGNRQLDPNEVAFRPLTSQWLLNHLHRVQITVTTESDQPDPLNPTQRRQVTLTTEVGLRNMPFSQGTGEPKPVNCCP